jgi:hypothetical protein
MIECDLADLDGDPDFGDQVDEDARYAVDEVAVSPQRHALAFFRRDTPGAFPEARQLEPRDDQRQGDEHRRHDQIGGLDRTGVGEPLGLGQNPGPMSGAGYGARQDQ